MRVSIPAFAPPPTEPETIPAMKGANRRKIKGAFSTPRNRPTPNPTRDPRRER